MKRSWLVVALLLAGCATTKTPTATNLADSSAMTVSVKPARGWRDAELTVTDPKTGEAFTGRIPGTRPAVVIGLGGSRTGNFSGMTSGGQQFSGTTTTSAPMIQQIVPPPNESVGVLKGDKGGTLVCKFNPAARNGLCVTPADGYVYVDF
jgi:hypothetical protein